MKIRFREIVSKNNESIVSVITIVLIAFSRLLASDYYSYMLFIMAALIVIYPVSGIVPLYVSSLSSNYFAITVGIGIDRIIAIAFIIGVLLRYVNRKVKGEKSWFLIIELIPVSFIFSYFFAISCEVQSVIWLTNGLSYLIFISSLFVELDARQIVLIKHLFQTAAVVIIVVLFCDTLLNGTLVGGRITITEDVNNNNFAMMTSQLGMLSLSLFFLNRKRKQNYIYLGLALMALFLTILSGSRTSLIAMFVTSFILLLLGDKRKGYKKVFVIALVLLLSYCMLDWAMSNYSELGERLNIAAIIHSGGSGRLDVIKLEIKEIIPKHWLFGIGPSTIYETAAIRSYDARLASSSHNIVIAMLTQFGVFGLIVHWIFYYKIISKLKEAYISCRLYKRENVVLVPLTLLITALVNGIGENIFAERFFWVILSICIIFFNYVKTLKDTDRISE